MFKIGRIASQGANYIAKPIKRAGKAIDKRVDSEMRHNFKRGVFKAGSYLTEPWCKCRQYAYQISLTNKELYPQASPAECVARRVGMVAGIVLLALIGVITTPIGLALRAIAASVEKEPFIFKQTGQAMDIPKNREISVMTWNGCMVGGGYHITDGNNTHPMERVKRMAAEIGKLQAQVFCGQEYFDIVTTEAMIHELKKEGYTQFYYNIGARALGTSSGLFVASKVALDHPRFIRYEHTDGRAKYKNGGVFYINILENDEPVARILTLHMQHSEELNLPTTGEAKARLMQMKTNLALAKETPLFPTIMLGDFNMNDKELKRQEMDGFTRGDISALADTTTYDGDAWVAKKMKKTAASPQNLDYVFSNKPIKTRIPFDIQHDPNNFTQESLSDHKPLLSVFKV